jgi:light-regulated signal transduction histidine kinase (bacteriophytochrome)
VGFYKDYRGVPVIGAYKWLPEFKMCIITEIDQAEAFGPIVRLAWIIAGIASVISIAVGFLGLFFARTITRPVQKLAAGAEEIGSGNLEHRVGTTAKDEIGGLSRTFDRMAENLKATMVSRDELEQRVRDRTVQLEAANKELEAFSYSVSHDLRAPLRSIDGFSQALLEDYFDKIDEQGKDHLRRVRSATQRMAQLIDDVLNLSRVTRSEMRFEKIDLSTLVSRIRKELQERQPDRKVEFAISPGLVGRGDARLLRIVLENLLGNAWKFTGKHPLAKIEFGITHVGHGHDKPVFYVRDDGAGFDMAYVDKLFAPFQRLHAPTEFPGTGIGLATVQRIIHRHGGRVWAEGEVEKGATFFFTLP